MNQLLEIARTDRTQALRIVAAARRFADGDGGDVKKSQGRRDEWRLRAGDWRIVFTTDLPGNAVLVLAVLSRRDAYE